MPVGDTGRISTSPDSVGAPVDCAGVGSRGAVRTAVCVAVGAGAAPAARPELLRLLQSAEYRGRLKALDKALAATDAEELLGRLIAEFAVAELVHNCNHLQGGKSVESRWKVGGRICWDLTESRQKIMKNHCILMVFYGNPSKTTVL